MFYQKNHALCFRGYGMNYGVETCYRDHSGRRRCTTVNSYLIL